MKLTPTPNPERSQVLSFINQQLNSYGYPGTVSESNVLSGNIDSLDLMCIAHDIEQEYSLEISEQSLMRWEKVSDIIDCVVSHNAAGV